MLAEYEQPVSELTHAITIYELTDLSQFKPTMPPNYLDSSIYFPKGSQDSEFKLMQMSEEEFVGPVATWEDAIYVHGADAAIYWDDPKGIYKGCVGDELMGACASFRKGPNIGWLGYYMVRPQYRKKGYGLAMFNEVIERDKIRNVTHHTFNCIEPLMPMYEHIGFENFSFDTIFRGVRTKSEPTTELPSLPFTQIWFDKVNEYDRYVHRGWDRKNSLSQWINKKGSKLLVAVSAQEKVVGFVVISDVRWPTTDGMPKHQRLAPLYADSPEIAHQLIAASLEICECESIFVDADGNNREAINVVNSFGIFSPQFLLARMSRPEPVDYYRAACVYSHTHYGCGV